MAKYLNVQEVAELAVQVAKRIRLRVPSAAELHVALKRRRAPAQLITDGYAQLWLDRLYVAHSTIDDPVVHYVYLTDTHVAEEYCSFRTAREARANKVFLPKWIEVQFEKALRKMAAEDKSYVVFESQQ
jgi:hypothetical protein